MKEKKYEEMSILEEFAFIFGGEPNWGKVEKTFGKKETNRIKKEREAFSSL